MKITKKAAVGVAVIALALSGCSSAKSAESAAAGDELVVGGEVIASAKLLAAAKNEGSLVFYTGASEQSEAKVAEAFSEATGINVDIVRLAPNKLSERVLSENAAKKLGADVIRISGEDLIKGFADEGVFQKFAIDKTIAKNLIPEATFEDGLYYNSFDRVYSFGFNNQVISEKDAPQNWADLVKSKYSGQTGIVQVGAGGSTAALTRFQLDKLGEKWLKDYAANSPRIYDSSAALTDGLARGEIAIGTIPIATAYGAVLDGAPITIAVPKEGAAAYPFYLGVTSQAKNVNAAKVFVNWLMSLEGQNLAASLGDYPVHNKADDPSIGEKKLPALDSGFLYRSSLENSLKHLESDAEEWKQIFGYTG